MLALTFLLFEDSSTLPERSGPQEIQPVRHEQPVTGRERFGRVETINGGNVRLSPFTG